MCFLNSKETWAHQDAFDWNIACVYGLIYKLADTKMSTRSELEEMFSYLSGRHKCDNLRKGPWQSEERVYFHNSLLWKRVPKESAQCMQLHPRDFLNQQMRTARTGRHWFASDSKGNASARTATIKRSEFLALLDKELSNGGLKSGML
jgi:hypothetical protein